MKVDVEFWEYSGYQLYVRVMPLTLFVLQKSNRKCDYFPEAFDGKRLQVLCLDVRWSLLLHDWLLFNECNDLKEVQMFALLKFSFWRTKHCLLQTVLLHFLSKPLFKQITVVSPYVSKTGLNCESDPCMVSFLMSFSLRILDNRIFELRSFGFTIFKGHS